MENPAGRPLTVDGIL